MVVCQAKLHPGSMDTSLLFLLALKIPPASLLLLGTSRQSLKGTTPCHASNICFFVFALQCLNKKANRASCISNMEIPGEALQPPLFNLLTQKVKTGAGGWAAFCTDQNIFCSSGFWKLNEDTEGKKTTTQHQLSLIHI